jgi:tetratricopeptide (TPR) repeat protein
MTSNNRQSRPRFSLCMIVRDNARTLAACLAIIARYVDEIIVVDTGSLDETPEIARRYGAKVFFFPWIDDFSAARNESIKHATGEWIFWLDSDDTIDEFNAKKLRELAYSASPPEILGYIMQVHCPGPENGRNREVTCVDHVKLFRNHPAIRFEHRIHEQILGAIRRLGGQVAWTDLFVVHSGSEHSAEAKQKKYDRDLRLLKLDLAERPNHPFILFNLGMTFDDMGAHEEAVNWLRRCLEVSHIEESHVRKAYALLANSLSEMGNIREALSVCREGVKFFEHDLELRFREGILLHKNGELLPAVESYRRVLEVQESRHFTSVDPSIGNVKARHNLALVYEELGRFDLAEMQWRLALEASEDFMPAYRALFGVLLKQRKFVTCARLIHNWCAKAQVADMAELLEAEFMAAKGDIEPAHQKYRSLMQRWPEDWQVLQSASQFLFQYGDPHETQAVLRCLIGIKSDDAAAFYNLAQVCRQLDQLEEAKSAIQESSRLRPGNASAQEILTLIEDQLAQRAMA